jgi:U3 small nucleolar RNA-associated protein 20
MKICGRSFGLCSMGYLLAISGAKTFGLLNILRAEGICGAPSLHDNLAMGSWTEKWCDTPDLIRGISGKLLDGWASLGSSFESNVQTDLLDSYLFGFSFTDLQTSFEATSSPHPDGTDRPTVVGLLLRTLQQVPQVAEAHSRQVVPLLLEFAEIPKEKTFEHWKKATTSEQRGGLEEEDGAGAGFGVLWGSKPWREGLKQWLALLEEMKNARALFRNAEVKELLLGRLLLDSDPGIQQLALSCLLNWKDPHLVPYTENLQRLVAPKTSRDELTHWDIGSEGGAIIGGAVMEEHREGVMKVVIHIMYPKLKKKATKQTSKATGGVSRAAVLGFLARMSARELAPFFKLLLQPLSPAFRNGPLESLEDPSQEAPGSKTWEEDLVDGVGPSFLGRVDPNLLAAVPYKRRVGFLHMARELVDSWGEALLGPYLHALLGVTVRILESVGRNGGVEEEAIEGGEVEAQIGGVKVDGNEGEEREEEAGLSAAAQLGLESGEAALPELEKNKEDGEKAQDESPGSGESDEQEPGSKVPAAGNDKDLRSLSLRVLSSVLSRFPALVSPKTQKPETPDSETANPQSYWDLFFGAMAGPISRIRNDSASSEKPSALLACFLAMSRHPSLAPLLGSDPNLVPGLLSILSIKGASQSVLGTVLTIVENLLEMDSELGVRPEDQLLLTHLPLLLSNLQQLLTLQRDQPVSGKSRKPSFKRELSILVSVSRHVTGGDAAAQLTSALMPLLRAPGGKRKIDEEACAAALRVLEGLGGVLGPESVGQCVPVLAPLFISLQSREARIALSGALEGLARAGTGSATDPAVGQTASSAGLSEPAEDLASRADGTVEVRITQGFGTSSTEVKLGLHRVAGLLSDLNAMDPSTVDECDYGRRLDAYSRLELDAFKSMTRLEARLVLSQCLHDMQEEDLSLRHSAAHAIELFLRYAAKVVQEEGAAMEVGDPPLADVAHDDNEIPQAGNGVTAADADVSNANVGAGADGGSIRGADGAEAATWAVDGVSREEGERKSGGKLEGAGGVVSLVTRLLLPHVRKGLAHETLVVRREYVLLFR